MTEDGDTQRREKYLRQTNEQFAALGRYVQEFELVCFTLRHLIASLLLQNGLKDQSLPATFLNHQSFTARVLLDTACSMILHLYKCDSDVTEVVNDLRRRLGREVETRNDYLHGTWFIGWASGDQQDFAEMTGWKLTTSPAKGLGLKQLATSAAEMEARMEALEEINDAFRRLWGCLVGKFSVKKNFVKYEGRYVSPDTVRRRGWKISDP